MALASNNITPRLANTELGSPFGTNDLTVEDVCEYASQNEFSFYGPWTLSTDANKDVQIDYGTNNHKLGDFRSYNHTASTPSAASNFTQNYSPSASYIDMTIVSFPNALNVLEADSNATYIRYNAYLSTANRSAETSRYDQDTNSASFYAITPLSGHTRTQSSRIDSTHIDTFSSFYVGSLSTPNDYIYLDTFFSNISGTRLVNLGSVSGGYTTITMHEQQTPYITATGNISPPPTSWTAAWPEIHTSSTPVCSTTSQITQSPGGTSYAFYVKIKGVYLGDKVAGASAAKIYLTHDGGKQLIYSGSMSHTSSRYCSGTLSNSNTWSYDEVGYVTIEDVTWSGSSTSC